VQSLVGIVALIVQESVVITVISGFVGIGVGVLTLSLIGDSLEEFFIKASKCRLGNNLYGIYSIGLSQDLSQDLFRHTELKIKPIEALRTE
jgi:putative ABC transport system permease protein